MGTTTPANASAAYKQQIADISNQLTWPRTAEEISASVTPVSYKYPPLNVLRYGTNTTPGTTDMTAAIQAAVDVAYAHTANSVGGATVIIPAGHYAVTSIDKQFTAIRSVNIRGDGINNTQLQKIGATTTPVINFYGATLFGNCKLSDFMVLGNAKAHDGIRLTLLSQCDLSGISVYTCATGIDLVGSLLLKVRRCIITGNSIGLKTRQSGGVWANQLRFDDLTISSNSSFGVDIGQGDNIFFNGCDFETNGTTGNAATGAVIIRDTVDGTGHTDTNISIDNTWFEWNHGTIIEVEDALGLKLSMTGIHIFTNSGGSPAGSQLINVGTIKLLHLERFNYGTQAGDTLVSAADETILIGCDISTYTDNSETTNITNHIETRAVYAEGAAADLGQVGPFAYMAFLSGKGIFGAYDYDAATSIPLQLSCTHVQIPAYSDAQLNDITHAVNTGAGKVAGAIVFNWSQGLPAFPVNNTDGGVWVDGAGTTINTPV